MEPRLVLVYPWLYNLREPFDGSTWGSTLDGDEGSDPGSSPSSPLYPRPVAKMDDYTRALRLVVRLRQPFHALLLQKQRNVEFRRVATGNEIVVPGLGPKLACPGISMPRLWRSCNADTMGLHRSCFSIHTLLSLCFLIIFSLSCAVLPNDVALKFCDGLYPALHRCDIYIVIICVDAVTVVLFATIYEGVGLYIYASSLVWTAFPETTYHNRFSKCRARWSSPHKVQVLGQLHTL